MNTSVSWLLTENSRKPAREKLSELGWFYEGFGALLTELTGLEMTSSVEDP